MRVIPRAAVVLVILAAGGSACRRTTASAAADDSTYHLVCKHCNHVWVIEREQVRTYPADANGGGFKCEKCGKFGGRIGKQCNQCKTWYFADWRGMPCPECKKGNSNPESPSTSGRRSGS